MSTLPHYFIGIPVSADVKETFSVWQDNLKTALPFKQWTDKDDFHITLRFLGPVREVEILEMGKKLKQIESQEPFSLNIDRIGTFGNKQQPRVLFAEVGRTNALMALYEHVETCLAYMGYSRETRPFHPHITFAKKWNDSAIRKERIDKKEYMQQNVALNVNSIVLFRVFPKQTPKYRVVYKYVLRGETNGTAD